MEKIHDLEERYALEVQIGEFGQVPKQLFASPHPARIIFEGKRTYIIYVFWGQLIKLIQVVSIQNFMNIDVTTLILIFWIQRVSAGTQKQEYKSGHDYFTG